MTWRFQRRIPLGRALRLNLSRSGVSVSAGLPGARVTLARRGIWGTFGLPGSGISYRTRTYRRRGSSGLLWLIVAIVLAAVALGGLR